MRRGIRLKYVKTRGRLRYYGPPGRQWVPLPPLPMPENHPDFLRAYAEAAASAPAAASVRDAKAGTIAAAIIAYRASDDWRGLADNTRRQRVPILDAIRAKAGAAALSGLSRRHIENDLRGLAKHAFNRRLKAWRGLLRWAVETAGLITVNPAEGIKAKTITSDGHRRWSVAEVEQYRAAHPYGTTARLAFELAYWTGARRGDLVRLGHQMVSGDGWLEYRQSKTGGEVEVPFTCALPAGCAGLTDDHRHLLRALEARNGRDAMLFLTTIRGTPHSVKAFGAWFKKHVIAAGLPPDCTLHGLRKARASVLGELGWSSLKIGAWTGHTSLSEIERYTKKAVRRRMLEGPEQEQNLGNRVVAFSQNGEKTNENKAKG